MFLAPVGGRRSNQGECVSRTLHIVLLEGRSAEPQRREALGHDLQGEGQITMALQTLYEIPAVRRCEFVRGLPGETVLECPVSTLRRPRGTRASVWGGLASASGPTAPEGSPPLFLGLSLLL